MMEDPSDRPIFDPGEIICSNNGDFAFRIIELIGEGRCCLVYSGRSLRENTKVALKFFKRGPHYDGAVQREQYILETLGSDPKNNIVLCFGFFEFKGLHCQVMELLEHNIRQIIYRNDRKGLSAWATQKFALDILTSLNSLHSRSFVHADLKPANLMWSSYDGCFKLLDFGLTFHTDEQDLHQIQSSGYKSPEVAEWNKFKEELKRNRKRKLQGTYTDLTATAPAFGEGLDEVGSTVFEDPRAKLTMIAKTTLASSNSSCSSAQSKDGLRPPPPRLAPPANSARKPNGEGEEESPPYERPKRKTDTDKWPSESSGIYTGSIQSRETSTADLDSKKDTTLVMRQKDQTRRFSCYGSEESTSLSWMMHGGTPTVSYESWLSSQCSADFGRSESVVSNNCEGSTNAQGAEAGPPGHTGSEEGAQEWRGGRSRTRNGNAAVDSSTEESRKRAPRPTSICAASNDHERRPVLPNEACDIWSFGCLLVEVITGRKMFSATDKMATILKPHQLLEMKLGPTEVKYDEGNQLSFFLHAKDLIQKCLMEDPTERISCENALVHPFFRLHTLKPSLCDMVLLPSSVLQLLDIFDSSKNSEDGDIQDALRDIREEAEKYGRVTDLCRHGGHAYIEFEEASDCQKACTGLTGRKFDNRTVLATFYPPKLWAKKIFV